MIKLFVVLLGILSIAYSQNKTIDLDQQKSQAVIEECKNIQRYQLIKNSKKELVIKCHQDNLQFIAKDSLPEIAAKLRIGTFNLLHPGTNKTLFKDFDLVAKLIHKEFDILTAVELVDVNNDTKAKNAKILPHITERYSVVENLEIEIEKQNNYILELESSLAEDNSNLDQIRDKIRLEEDKLIVSKEQLANIKLEIENNLLDIQDYSKPLIIIFKKELFKKARLKKLAYFQQKDLDLKNAQINKELEISDLNKNILKLSAELNAAKPGLSEAGIQRINIEKKKLDELNVKFESEIESYRKYSDLYQLAGYLKLLISLRKINKNWSLVLSPHPEAALETSLQEYVGFFFRSDRTQLDENIHCSDRYNKSSSACYPNFYSSYMGKDYTEVFSRRPFMATFKGPEDPFTIMGAHVVFDSPTDELKMKKILNLAFKVDSLSELGSGITKSTYARFAEVKVSLMMLKKLRNEGLEQIIYTGDLNLEAQNSFFKNMVEDFKLLIEEKTSISETRFSAGKETLGLASNYDHFIMSAKDYSRCQNEKNIDYINGSFADDIKEKYLIRKESSEGPYNLIYGSSQKINSLKNETRRNLEILNSSIQNNSIIIDQKSVDGSMQDFEDRVIQSQIVDKTYYKFFSQVMSDHLPIKIECSF